MTDELTRRSVPWRGVDRRATRAVKGRVPENRDQEARLRRGILMPGGAMSRSRVLRAEVSAVMVGDVTAGSAWQRCGRGVGRILVGPMLILFLCVVNWFPEDAFLFLCCCRNF